MALTKIHAYPSTALTGIVGIAGTLTGLAISSASFTPSATKVTHEDGVNYRAATIYNNPGFKATLEAAVLKASSWGASLDSKTVGGYVANADISVVDTDRHGHGVSDMTGEMAVPVWAIDDISRKDTKGDVGTVTISFDLVDKGA